MPVSREVPPAVLDACRPLLVAVLPHERELFELRLRRWWPDLLEGLAGAYDNPDELACRVAAIAAAGFARRDAELKTLDLKRSLEPDWFQRPDMIGYAAYAERFAGGIAGVAKRVGYLGVLGVTYLHLMPLLRPRDGDNDGGYAVADYQQVREDLGTIDDLRSLATNLRGSGISLCIDLVLNHVAREHPWAVAARGGDERYSRYFHVYPDRTVPDAVDATVPEVFPDFAPGHFTWDDDLSGWVWTTFNSWQWDLAWDNPEVFCEMADVVLFLANLGVEVLRLDAIAFLWKRVGTTCQNQPEVHFITQALHALTRIAAPATVLKAEAIVGPADLVAYLGQGRHHGKVADLAYHNSLMVQIWSMLASREVDLAVQALGAIPVIPSSTAWITYLRCHDDIGWAVDDADAASVGLSGFEHRAFLSDFYSGEFPGSFARGLVFQPNRATGDRRISGSAASLAGVEAALASGDDRALDDAVGRLLLAHALLLGWGGIPVLWSGDEVAMPSDGDWACEQGHEDDNRWAHRPRLDWATVADARDPSSQSVGARVWRGLRTLIEARAGTEHFHASVASEVTHTPDSAVLAVLRPHPVGLLVGVYNVSERATVLPGWWLRATGMEPTEVVDRITGEAPPLNDSADVLVPPYGALWLTAPET
ncbi:MAG: alpha-amylase family protein [Actinomycetes bacterium]